MKEISFEEFFQSQDLEDTIEIEIARNVVGAPGGYTIWMEGFLMGRDQHVTVETDDILKGLQQCLAMLKDETDDYDPTPTEESWH